LLRAVTINDFSLTSRQDSCSPLLRRMVVPHGANHAAHGSMYRVVPPRTVRAVSGLLLAVLYSSLGCGEATTPALNGAAGGPSPGGGGTPLDGGAGHPAGRDNARGGKTSGIGGFQTGGSAGTGSGGIAAGPLGAHHDCDRRDQHSRSMPRRS